MRYVFAAMLMVTFGCTADAPQNQAQEARAEPAPYEIIANQGNSYFVYVAPEVLEDRFAVAQALQDLFGPNRNIQVHIFDNRFRTPRAFPMTDRQMLHWRANYSNNTNSGFEEFQWLILTDSTTSPPTHDVRVDEIRPGFASEVPS